MVSFLGLENKLFLFYPISSMLAFSCVAVLRLVKERPLVSWSVIWDMPPLGGPLSTTGRGRQSSGAGLPPIIIQHLEQEDRVSLEAEQSSRSME